MNKQIKKIGKYRLIKKIGKGSTSEVYESVREGSNEKFAIKVIPLLGLDENQRLMIKREVDIIRNIRHANIVHLYDTIETKNNNYLVF